MAGLNLSALKNISTAPVAPDTSKTASIETPVASATAAETPKKTPRISLLKLKQQSGNDGLIEWATEETVTSITETPATSVTEKMRLFPKITTKEVETETIVATEEIIIEKANEDVIETTTEIISESTSVFNNTLVEDLTTQETAPEKIDPPTEEPKEFFPGLHLMEEFNFSDDTLKFEDAPKIKAIKPAEIMTVMREITASEIIKSPTIEEVTPVVTPIITPLETTPVSSEYVEQVKNELSEERPGGLRFFAKKKSLAFAGIGVCILSIGAFFMSNQLGSITPAGKTNVNEVVVPKNVEPVPEVVLPVVKPTNPTQTESGSLTPDIDAGYAEGRDYTVIKNTKKNHRNEQ